MIMGAAGVGHRRCRMYAGMLLSTAEGVCECFVAGCDASWQVEVDYHM